jgi:hypothetical protein
MTWFAILLCLLAISLVLGGIWCLPRSWQPPGHDETPVEWPASWMP